MGTFMRYQHVERFGRTGVRGIEKGTCYVFPKIDGANASAWLTGDGRLHAASRNRELGEQKKDNGFFAFSQTDEKLRAYLEKHPDHRLFGEWLIPHTLKNYEADAWNRFYVFDVAVADERTSTGLRYLPYDAWQQDIEASGLDYIKPLGVVENGTFEDFMPFLEKNTWLVREGGGIGEGIVIKNYSFFTEDSCQVWAKIVAKDYQEMRGELCLGISLERQIVEEFLSASVIEKEFAKMKVANGGFWDKELISPLFRRIFKTLVEEEMWEILVKYKNPVLDFGRMFAAAVNKTKETIPDLFQYRKKVNTEKLSTENCKNFVFDIRGEV